MLSIKDKEKVAYYYWHEIEPFVGTDEDIKTKVNSLLKQKFNITLSLSEIQNIIQKHYKGNCIISNKEFYDSLKNN